MFWRRRGERGSAIQRGEPERVTARVPEPSFVAPAAVLRSSLGPDTTVTGRLSFTVPTRIDGTLRGEVRARDLLVIGERGYVEGVVHAPTLVVLGEVRGEVRGAQHVEVGSGGRLMGMV